MGLVHAIEWVWSKLHRKTIDVKANLAANAASAHGATMSYTPQKIHSILDVNLYDPGKMISTAHGRTEGDKMDVNLGTNMSLARA